MKHLLLIMTLAFFCCSFIHCTGNECSATSTITSDYDSDCVEDAADNCPRNYNPNQEDIDEDLYGDACEAVQCINDANCVGINFQAQPVAYNLRGLYEATSTEDSACEGFATLSFNQSDDEVVVINEDGQILKGRLTESSSPDVIKSAFQNSKTYCQMSFEALNFNYHIKCYDKTSQEFCENTGLRTVTEVTNP